MSNWPGRGGADVQRHANALAAVVGGPGSDHGEVAAAVAEMLRKHLLAALETAARDHDRPGAERALSPVVAANDHTVDASLVGDAQGDSLGLVEQLDAGRPLQNPASPSTIATPPPTGSRARRRCSGSGRAA